MTRNATLLFQKDFTAAELSARRARVMSEMGSGLAVTAESTLLLDRADPFQNGIRWSISHSGVSSEISEAPHACRSA